jgi:hypothetical protein
MYAALSWCAREEVVMATELGGCWDVVGCWLYMMTVVRPGPGSSGLGCLLGCSVHCMVTAVRPGVLGPAVARHTCWHVHNKRGSSSGTLWMRNAFDEAVTAVSRCSDTP